MVLPAVRDGPDAGERESVGIDVGGTKTSVLRVTAEGRIVARLRRPTPYAGASALVTLLIDMVEELRTPQVAAVGVGLPGTVDFRVGALVTAPRPNIRDAPVREPMEQALGLPVAVDNDANVAAWAEYRLGAARGHPDMIMITVGTGLGCGIIAGGRVLRGTHGFAAEIWHLPINGEDHDPTSWSLFVDGAAGAAVTTLGRELALGQPASLIARLAESPALVTGETVTAAAGQGDEMALEILTRVGTFLGRGIAVLVHMLDPSVVVVGGGAADADDLLLGPTRAAFKASRVDAWARPDIPIVRAEHGNDAGALGAAMLALDHLAPASPPPG